MPASTPFPRASGAHLAMLLSGGLVCLTLGGTAVTAAAGDLLRGGYNPNASQSSNPASFTAPSVIKARANMEDVLARATQEIEAMQQMQSAARKLAAGANNLGINPNVPGQTLPNVPNGLGNNGLNPMGGVTALSSGGYAVPAGWTGVESLNQRQSGNGTTVTIVQDKQDAVLTWNTFNIGARTTLDFNQSKGGKDVGDWVAFNLVEGSAIAPSQILGAIQAPGQVYVINQNGIIFGGASQVNVHALVASSLPIDTNLISRGLLNNPDDQFLFSQIAVPAGSNGPTPVFTPPAAPVNGEDGDVTVEAGAEITAPASANSVGGRVALIGPNVTNAGTISTPDGQTILAAGEQVGFLASTDASLRGLDTYIGVVDASSGNATNTGSIEVDEGDATMAGKSVNQLGLIASTTSVTLNGRIDLDAAYGTKVVPIGNSADLFAPAESGIVTLGADSETEILPELSSAETVVGTTLALPSQVNMEGEAIHFATDAQVLAPNANVTVSAGNWVQSGNLPAQLIPNSGQIYFDAGASIDVEGSIVSAPVSENIVAAQLLGPEFADSPLQRNGELYGQTIEVDAREAGVYDGIEWEGTPLANVTGYIDLIQRPVGELTAAGGNVSLTAGGSVVMQPESEINVSGGAINYQGGMVQTTYLLSGGRIINIADATPDVAYQGILGTFTVDHPKWGIEETYTTPLVGGGEYQASYVEGGNGGTITIEAPAVALDGALLGETSPGARQLQVPPAASSLTLSFQMQTTLSGDSLLSPTPPHVVFEDGGDQTPVGAFAVDGSGTPLALPADREAEVILSPELLEQDGFGSLTVNDGDGDITVPAGVALSAAPWGSITLTAANLDIQGSITAPDGLLDFTVYDYSPYAWLTYSPAAAPPAANPDRGHFVLGAGASLSTAGLIVDNLPYSATANSSEVAINGGTISITSYSADLEGGSTINVSGGVEGEANKTLSYGAGGAITIAAGRDPDSVATLGGKLTLDAALAGFSGSRGGSLSILAPAIQIGGRAPRDADTLVLEPGFFSEGGFASFALTGLGSAIDKDPYNDLPAVLIAAGTQLTPVAENWVGMIDSANGEGIALAQALLPEAQRTPASLSFSAPGVTDEQGDLIVRGDFVMGDGATITTDAGGSLTISANTATVLGSIFTPGGTISINGSNDSNQLFDGGDAKVPLATVYLGPDAYLSAAGTTVQTPNFLGEPSGAVLGGGSISISGNIVAAAGSTLNVSGASGVLYMPEADTVLGAQGAGSFLGEPIVPFREDSDGGTITLTGQQELFTEATLIGAAGGPAAVGGSLTISSGRYFESGEANTPAPTDPTLVVTQDGATIPVSTGAKGVGQAILESSGEVLSPEGEGHIAVESFQGGGFNAVTLAGTVQFQGDVDIMAGGAISVGSGGVIIANGAVTLDAPYVALGMPFEGPLTESEVGVSPFGDVPGATFAPHSGPGSLTVIADLIDIGNLSLQDIARANFIAANGDIRGDGTLDVAGKISVTAGQIYPPTDMTFEIAAYDENVVVASSVAGNATVTLASTGLPPGFGVGSPLLGSTVKSIAGATVTLAAGADASISTPTPEVFAPGSGTVAIHAAGTNDLPLSAGGTLDVYAANIDDDGVLRAPLGTINLGWNAGSGTAPIDPITGEPVESTNTLTLGARSITSVSAVDPATGQALIIPYGSNPTGTEWIDPAGNNITAGGAPEKTINIAGAQIADEKGSVIDMSGGGDLSSYEFVAGEGGSTDFLNPGTAWLSQPYSAGQIVSYKGSSWVAVQQTTAAPPAVNQYWSQIPASYAVIPGKQAGFAPYAPFNSVVGDAGYVSAGLQVGGEVYLGTGSGLAPGYYTLLPARYALLPGAYLVTPDKGAAVAGQTLPDGSTMVSGYLFNGLSNPGGLTGAVISRFEVDSQAVVLSRGEYDTFLGNSFLAQGAGANKTAAPQLPDDAGELNIDASNSLVLQGIVDAGAPEGGSAGFVDLYGPANIDIGSAGGSGQAGTLTLSSSELSSFGAANLLIGGFTTTGADGTTVTVETNNVTVEQGATLSGPDIILVANDNLTVEKGAKVKGIGTLTGQPKKLQIQDAPELESVGDSLGFAKGGVPISFPQGTPGNDSLTASVGVTITLPAGSTATFAAGKPFTLSAGSSVTLNQGGGTLSFHSGTAGPIPLIVGDGTLLQVSSGAGTEIARSGVAALEGPEMTVGAGATIAGASVDLNSTDATSLDPNANIQGKSITLGSGQISIELSDPGTLQATSGLVLAGKALQSLEGAGELALLSYSSIDIYGTGTVGSASLANLSLDAAEIRGFGDGSEPVIFQAKNIVLDNGAGGTGPGAVAPAAAATLEFEGGTIELGAGQIGIDQYADVELNATGGVLAEASGEVSAQGGMEITAPLITGLAAADETISAEGALTVQSAAGTSATVMGGLGAKLTLEGASVTDNGNIAAASGQITLHASSGNLTVGNLAATSLDAGGTAKVLVDQTKYTGGGTITLIADAGMVLVGAEGTLNVAAQPGGGNAGTLTINAPEGSTSLLGKLLGTGGAGGENGTFSLDAGSIPAEGSDAQGSLTPLETILAAGGFTRSVTIRDQDDALVTVDGVANAETFNVSADTGSIDVTGIIDASGATGGAINLAAAGSVTLEDGAVLNVSGQNFNAAGQGGSVTLSAGAYTGGNFTNVALGTGPQVNIAAGSTIDLSVAANSNATVTAANAALGDCNGTLLISAPQALGNTDLQVQPIDGTIKNASSIILEGVQVFDATDGSVDNQEGNVLANGDTFVGIAGAPATASYTAMVDRLFANNMGLITPDGGNPAVAVIEPGAEIVNPEGDLTLEDDWDLETNRFGPDSEAGVLTLRASGNLIFQGALSDGFTTSSVADSSGSLWQATLIPQNTLLPVNAQDYSYDLTAGADFSGASLTDVLPAGSLGGSGSLELGINDPHPDATPAGPNGTTEEAVDGYYQVIRTGAGSIDIAAGANVELLNQFATIYTAGTPVLDPTMGGTFSVPVLDESKNPKILGTSPAFTPGYPAQYSEAGGDVTIAAGENIEHLTENLNGVLVMDSESELPNNWLYRRGDVAASGVFDSNSKIGFGGDPSESTTWWVDFSNFFEGVGALGGGNVTMVAGRDIANVDAVIPTNARMPGIGATGNLAPNANSLVQLGGGDLVVEAGDDLNAGVYYVESGVGDITAGNEILTNSTRAPVGGSSSTSGPITAPSNSWLPTTLFAGDASFDVTAGGNLLLGPVANPFMLPEGLNNSIWYKTYFSTYATTDAVDVTSLGGDITFREYASSSYVSGSILQVWLQNMDLLVDPPYTSRSYYQPWLRLDETSTLPFSTVADMMPATLMATAFSGDINIAGSILLSPSPTGTLDLAAAGSIDGFQSLGANPAVTNWAEATIDISDSDPVSIPGVASPLGYQEIPGVGTLATQAGTTEINFLNVFSNLFAATETGAAGVSETEQALHAGDILHAGDSTPVQLYAAGGDISGVTLYSPTETRVIAGGDITDIALYLQNDAAAEISVVSAGGDIVAYDPSSPGREAALSNPEALLATSLPGDIQIAGPGTLEVLAGGDLDLGGQGPGGPSNSTGDGIASIGNTENPALPFAGADIIAAAGIGGSAGLGESELDFSAFIPQFVEGADGAAYLGELSGIAPSAPAGLDARSFAKLKASERDLLALDVFFLVLRDAGRDHNEAGSAGYGNYRTGLSAIEALFPKSGQGGDIDVTSRDIVTESGGNISLLAPDGEVNVGLNSTSGDDVTNLGIVTQDGGNISIFTSGDVNVGTSRIFTLRGGNEIIWSTEGNIDSGDSSKTVQSAPPTRVLVDPQSANVKTDLAGLATGGGIGVLASLAGVPAGNVDLIAPAGYVNAGEAGIRATGNLNIAAVQVLNASNISVGGASTGLPPEIAAPNLAGLTAASSAVGSAIGSAANAPAPQTSAAADSGDDSSIITVQVLGYGGGDGDD